MKKQSLREAQAPEETQRGPGELGFLALYTTRPSRLQSLEEARLL